MLASARSGLRHVAATRLVVRAAALVPSRTLVLPARLPFRPIALAQRGFNQYRQYSVLSQCDAKLYKYDDVKALVEKSGADALLIDVREPVEYQEGHIPGAYNVPFKSSPGAFDMPAEDFEESFGFEKPTKDKELVFYCLGGVRSTAAEELANTFGYAKRGNYVGSWEDWVAHENAAGRT